MLDQGEDKETLVSKALEALEEIPATTLLLRKVLKANGFDIYILYFLVQRRLSLIIICYIWAFKNFSSHL